MREIYRRIATYTIGSLPFAQYMLLVDLSRQADTSVPQRQEHADFCRGTEIELSHRKGWLGCTFFAEAWSKQSLNF